MEWFIEFWVLVGMIIGWWCWCRQMKTKKDYSTEKKNGVVPKGSFGWPFIGETLDFIASGYTSRPVIFMEKRKALYGKVFKTHILGTPIIVSTDPGVNKVILQNHGNIFIPAYPKTIRELFGEFSILQTNGAVQKRVHSLIGGFLRSPQFKARMTKDIEHYVNLTLSSWKDLPFLLVQEETKKFTFEVLVKVLMSIGPGNDLDFLKQEFGEFIKGLICLPIKFPGTRLRKSLKAREKIIKLVRKIAEERKMAMQMQEWEDDEDVKSEMPKDAVEVLLRENNNTNGDKKEKQSLPMDFITSHIIELMIPGEETVPMAMTLAVKFLSDCAVALKQLTEENMKLKRQKIDSHDDYSWVDYMSLSFTQNVINETLRVANIINAVWRKALKDIEINGILIPEGWCVVTSFSSVHLDEENYENPYKFDPWRWEKTGACVNDNCFTPFGGGQRLCPGLELSRLEISIFLHHLVTTYRWKAEKDDIIYFPTVKLKRKLPITVTPLANA